ncbi:MAG: hypothetical protein AVDCRST_MAG70-545 [uncultured Thermomicrobiales bacterium]|uniref:Uncharacterized protein n=1 Tax=uncultured Thermomicrobiales bacterium TaxID=1645740 RepID=A0A6J4UF32_9BACT|nr:MAG: hypothetical protein AVDCRST_MAG70-545 [uncultured Thermomicrobiales bacterium]
MVHAAWSDDQAAGKTAILPEIRAKIVDAEVKPNMMPTQVTTTHGTVGGAPASKRGW